MELRFSITIWLSFFTTGWYVVTKDPVFQNPYRGRQLYWILVPHGWRERGKYEST